MPVFYLNLKNVRLIEAIENKRNEPKSWNENTSLYVLFDFDSPWKQVKTTPMKYPREWKGLVQKMCYSTAWTDLQMKKLVIKLKIKHMWPIPDMTIGAAEVDFDSLFNGREQREMSIKSVDGTKTIMQLAFELAAQEFVEDVKFALGSIDITDVCENVMQHRGDTLTNMGCTHLFAHMLYMDPGYKQWHQEAIPLSLKHIRAKLALQEKFRVEHMLEDEGVSLSPSRLNKHGSSDHKTSGSEGNAQSRIVITEYGIKLDAPISVHDFLQGTIHLVLWTAAPVNAFRSMTCTPTTYSDTVKHKYVPGDSVQLDLCRIIIPVYGHYDVQHHVSVDFKVNVRWSDFVLNDQAVDGIHRDEQDDKNQDHILLTQSTVVIGTLGVEGGPQFVQMPYGKCTTAGITGRQHIGFRKPRRGAEDVSYCYLVDKSMALLLIKVVRPQGYSRALAEYDADEMPSAVIAKRYNFVKETTPLSGDNSNNNNSSTRTQTLPHCSSSSLLGGSKKMVNDPAAPASDYKNEAELINMTPAGKLTWTKLLNAYRLKYPARIPVAVHMLSLLKAFEREQTAWHDHVHKFRTQYKQLHQKQSTLRIDMYDELQMLTDKYNEGLVIHTQKIEWIRRQVTQRIAVYLRT
jgi:hypothetical protein